MPAASSACAPLRSRLAPARSRAVMGLDLRGGRAGRGGVRGRAVVTTGCVVVGGAELLPVWTWLAAVWERTERHPTCRRRETGGQPVPAAHALQYRARAS